MFWQCILGPQKMFNILTLFLLTLEADCNRNWTFSSLAHLNPFKWTCLKTFFEYLCVELGGLKVSKSRIRPKYWYLLIKCAPESTAMKNQNIFYRISLNPFKYTFLTFFLDNCVQNWMNFNVEKKSCQNINSNS
jgi:hypothetical protein